MSLFDDMWRQIHDAGLQRQEVVEFRMNEETRRDLIRSVESREAMTSLPGIERVFGIPVVVDPRMPEGVVGVIPPMADEPDWEVLQPTRPLFEPVQAPSESWFPDESPGMTLDDLIPETIDEWKRLRQDVTDDLVTKRNETPNPPR